MSIPTESIGSIPRTPELLAGVASHASGGLGTDDLAALYAAAVQDTIARLEQAGSPVVTDGEQTKPSFATYPLSGLSLAADGAVIPFADGHTRQLPRLTAGPFRYGTYAGGYTRTAVGYATVPVKQAVIAPSALSRLYRADGIDGYPR
ncbi:MAG: 5-methyltetrahydropteroyltriglutamate--homocysteine methyltransferase, partial [Catenulispora sp.]|nr:5-methyltetrahydropteroyltriglutamate--homocysteine methyltransferase [Catenulispora sp.]